MAEAWFQVRKPFWMEMHIFLPGTLCSGQRQRREPRRAQPAEHSGMKTSRLSCLCLGWRRPSGPLSWVLVCLQPAEAGPCPRGGPRAAGAPAERACSLAAEQNAAGKCSSRPFFPEHLVLCGLAAVSAKGPSGAQPPVPGKGLRLRPRWAGLTLSLRCLWAQAWPSVVSLILAAPVPWRHGAHPRMLWGHPGKGFVLMQSQKPAFPAGGSRE